MKKYEIEIMYINGDKESFEIDDKPHITEISGGYLIESKKQDHLINLSQIFRLSVIEKE